MTISSAEPLTTICSNAYTCPPEWFDFHLVQGASAQTGGQWFLGREAIVHSSGPHSAVCLHPACLEASQRGRATVSRITGKKEGWTTGQQARKIVAWLGTKRRATSIAAERLAETNWHYQLSEPCELDYGELWDVRAAYWQILRRFESPHVIWTDDTIIPAYADDEVMYRWEIMLDRLDGDKRLRNAIVGAMVGGGAGAIAFRRGELFSLPSVRGPMHDLGAAVVRICYELTELQAGTCDAVYANTDCVLIRDGGVPTFWDDIGLESRRQAQGVTDVRCIGCYKCGEHHTDYYDAETNAQIAERSKPLAHAGYWRHLL